MPDDELNKLEDKIALMALSALPPKALAIVEKALRYGARYEQAIGALRLVMDLLQTLDVDRALIAYQAATDVLDRHDGIAPEGESPYDAEAGKGD
jgi:hypothetical protein